MTTLKWVVLTMVLALAPVCILFLFFPDSTLEGAFGWGEAGGAIGAYIVIWWLAVRRFLRADALDSREQEIHRREQAQSIAEGARRPRDDRLGPDDLIAFKLRRAPRRQIVLVPGNIDKVTFAEVWVSSENTHMQMARFFENAISGVVRYLGSERDDTGRVVDDRIADALAAEVGRREMVAPGTAIVTESGALAGSHHVKAIVHVAAVEGEYAYGYRPVKNLAACVNSALSRTADVKAGSVLMPMFGAGLAGGELLQIARIIADEVIAYLEAHRDSPVETVYLLVFREVEKAAYLSVLDADERAARRPGMIPRHRLRRVAPAQRDEAGDPAARD